MKRKGAEMSELILASGSKIRQKLMKDAGINFVSISPLVDEEHAKLSLRAEGLNPQSQAHELAKLKALKVSKKYPQAFVIGCDQMLSLDNHAFDKANNMNEAKERLKHFSGKIHFLCNALVIYKNSNLVFRYDCSPKLKMRKLSDDFIDFYLQESGDEILSSVGCYQLENLGSQLFEKIEGDYFSILGLPLIELMSYLREIGLVRK